MYSGTASVFPMRMVIVLLQAKEFLLLFVAGRWLPRTWIGRVKASDERKREEARRKNRVWVAEENILQWCQCKGKIRVYFYTDIQILASSQEGKKKMGLECV